MKVLVRLCYGLGSIFSFSGDDIVGVCMLQLALELEMTVYGILIFSSSLKSLKERAAEE